MRMRTEKSAQSPRALSTFERLDTFVDQGFLHKLSPMALRIYIALHKHADNKTGRCWPGQDLLATLTIEGWSALADAAAGDKSRRPSRHRVSQALRELEQKQLLFVEQRGGGRKNSKYILGPFADATTGGSTEGPAASATTHPQRAHLRASGGFKDAPAPGMGRNPELSNEPSKQQINEPKRSATAPPSAAFFDFKLGGKHQWADLFDHQQRKALEDLISDLLLLEVSRSRVRKIALAFLEQHGRAAAARIISALKNRKRRDEHLPDDFSAYTAAVFENPAGYIDRLAAWLPVKAGLATKRKRKQHKSKVPREREWVCDPLAD